MNMHRVSPRWIELCVFAGLLIAAVMGWWNYLLLQMASRSNLREACYMTKAFCEFREQRGKMPGVGEVKQFPTRLQFLRMDGDRYLFACGLYGKDLLIVDPSGGERIEFWVVGGQKSD